MINIDDVQALEKMRLESDPVADAVIAKIIGTGDTKHIQTLFNVLRQNNAVQKSSFSDLPDDLRDSVWEYFQQGDERPAFVDEDKIGIGEGVFQKYGPEICILLQTMALPLCYACRKGAKVLVMTGRTLDTDDQVDPLARRLLETAQFVVYAMSPGGMRKGGMGIITTLKVRLIHASIRYYILNKHTNPSGWDVEEYGHPLNQEDLAGTLYAFSALTLHGLSKMGLQLGLEEKNAYMHCWKLVGHYNGLNPELLTDQYEEGWELGLAILRNQAAPSQDAKDLTKSCIDFIRAIMPMGMFTGQFESMMCYFCNSIGKKTGKNMSAILGMSRYLSIFRRMEIWLMDEIFRLLGKEEKALPFLQVEVGKFNQEFLKALSKQFFSKKGIQFYIPPGLKTNWNITV
ncbi:MAG: DUF2236 domain-containing protein [Bacteroidetes bacterium]|nr:DUF2236 domain-containing protein [Bacteroidota bacterium]